MLEILSVVQHATSRLNQGESVVSPEPKRPFHSYHDLFVAFLSQVEARKIRATELPNVTEITTELSMLFPPLSQFEQAEFLEAEQTLLKGLTVVALFSLLRFFNKLARTPGADLALDTAWCVGFPLALSYVATCAPTQEAFAKALAVLELDEVETHYLQKVQVQLTKLITAV